ncbi:restriction endonuclease FokI C-terminal domain-containing protein [Lacticaseibacillus sp. GG6-2]
MADRAFGWVQNPSDFQSLQRVVQIFDAESSYYQNELPDKVTQYIPFADVREHLLAQLSQNVDSFSYPELVGSSKTINGQTPEKRSLAVADALIQVTIPSQSAKTTGKYWTDNWTADGYLRWAVSFNFVAVDRDSDRYSLTAFGKQLSQAATPEQLTAVMQRGLLAYPPATRILTILSPDGVKLTKFQIGRLLGFSGESGFTSYANDLMVDLLTNAEQTEVSQVRNNIEGTSDKYARMIAGWLKKVGFVKTERQKIVSQRLNKKIAGFQTYAITGPGLHRLRQANGSAKNKRLSKFVMWEFFATGGTDRGYVRTRRALILQALMQTPTKSFVQLLKELAAKGIQDPEAVIRNDIDGLNRIGITIDVRDKRLKLQDVLHPFDIPASHQTIIHQLSEREQLKAQFLTETTLDPHFIALLDIAYDSNKNQDFEMLTTELFAQVYGLNAIHLGHARKPDAIVFTDKFGLIVDTKAYSQGYSRNVNQADEMVRYVTENHHRDAGINPNRWWESFAPEIPADRYYFLWVSSHFNGEFAKQLDYTAKRSHARGGALAVKQLLIGADQVLKGQLDVDTLPTFMTNQEIHFGDL